MNELTERQEDVFECINYFITKKGYSPTVRELCDLLNIKSPATIHTHLKQLVKKGYITYVPKLSRTIKIVGNK